MLARQCASVLHELRLIAAANGSGYGLDRAWEHTTKQLGDDAEPLRPLYERLKAGLPPT